MTRIMFQCLVVFALSGILLPCMAQTTASDVSQETSYPSKQAFSTDTEPSTVSSTEVTASHSTQIPDRKSNSSADESSDAPSPTGNGTSNALPSADDVSSQQQEGTQASSSGGSPSPADSKESRDSSTRKLDSGGYYVSTASPDAHNDATAKAELNEAEDKREYKEIEEDHAAKAMSAEEMTSAAAEENVESHDDPKPARAPSADISDNGSDHLPAEGSTTDMSDTNPSQKDNNSLNKGENTEDAPNETPHVPSEARNVTDGNEDTHAGTSEKISESSVRDDTKGSVGNDSKALPVTSASNGMTDDVVFATGDLSNVSATTSDLPQLDEQKKVSAPPKSATRKRSLNGTSSTQLNDSDLVSTFPSSPLPFEKPSTLEISVPNTEQNVDDEHLLKVTSITDTPSDSDSPNTVTTNSELSKSLELGSTTHVNPISEQSKSVELESAVPDTLASELSSSVPSSGAGSGKSDTTQEPEVVNTEIAIHDVVGADVSNDDATLEVNSTSRDSSPSRLVADEKEKLQTADSRENSMNSNTMNGDREVEDLPSTTSLSGSVPDQESSPSNEVIDGNSAGLGVTFDPNGLSNENPGDPDSVTFSQDPSMLSSTPRYVERLVEATETIFSSDGYEAELVKKLKQDMLYGVERTTDGNTRDVSISSTKENEGTSTASNPAVLPHDAPEVKGISPTETKQQDPQNTTEVLMEITSQTQTSKFPPASAIAKVSDESEEMMNDAPYLDFIDHAQSIFVSSPTTIGSGGAGDTAKEASDLSIVSSPSSIDPDVDQSNGTSSVKLVSDMEPQTEQSVIRPVKIRVISPHEVSASTSLLPDSSTPQTSENTAASPESPPATAQTTSSGGAVESSPDASSPIILPNPAPSVTDKPDQSVESSTEVMQPELVGINASQPIAVDTSNHTLNVTNSTIAGVAVKTSVSVSLPLLKTNNTHHSYSHVVQSNNASSSDQVPSQPVLIPNASTDVQSPTVVTPAEATASSPTTTTRRSLIRKPKLKIGGTEAPDSPRTRKPFISSLQRPSTTVGPPVSIFKKAGSRRPSITSSTTQSTTPGRSTVRIHYANRVPGMMPQGDMFSLEAMTTTEPTTTTEEYYSEEPFTDQTHVPSVSSDDDVTLIKVAGYIVVEKGIRWTNQLDNRHSPYYKEKATQMHLQLERLFRTSPIATRLWKIEIDGFSGGRDSPAVAVDFFLYLIKSRDEIAPEHLESIFHEKLKNNSFSRFRVDPAKTAFELLQEEPLNKPTPPPENTAEPPIPQWAIAVIVIGAASLIFIVLFAAVTMYGRHHMRRRYSNKLSEEDIDRSGDWENKLGAAYENLAADTIYDAEDLHSDTYKKRHLETYHGRPSKLKRCDSWSSSGWETPQRRQKPHVHRIVY